MTLYIEQAARPTATAAPIGAAAEFAGFVDRASAGADKCEADYGLAALENGSFFTRRLKEGHDGKA